MAANQRPWPREWLMTDERMGDRLWEAVDRCRSARGSCSAITLADETAARSAHGAARARRRARAGPGGRRRRRWHAGWARVDPQSGWPTGPAAARAPSFMMKSAGARERRVAASFVSPVAGHPLASGPTGALGSIARRIVAACPAPAIALGGMNEPRFAALDQADGFPRMGGNRRLARRRVRT